jgi:hypothetical protein
MSMKFAAIVVALTLSAAALAPIAAAHLTSTGLWLPSQIIAMDGTRDKCRAQGSPVTPCTSNSGMSGTYRGSAGVHVSSDQFPLAVGSLALVCADRATYDDADSGNLGPANGSCQLPTNPSCDLEWIVEGPFPANEAVVEGGALASGGLVPDGFWDDGGYFGGVCHTDLGPLEWQTAGCGVFYEEAFAADANPLVGSRVWISNECDYLVPYVIVDEHSEWFDCLMNRGVLGSEGVSGLVGGLLPGGDGEPDVEDVAAFLVDVCGPVLAELVLNLVPDFVPDHVPEPGEFEGIVDDIITYLTTLPDDDPADPFTFCGSDGVPDKANYGYGYGSLGMAGKGVANVVIGTAHPFFGPRPTCEASDAHQWGFVRDYVDVDMADPDTGQPTDARLAVTSGWYDVV